MLSHLQNACFQSIKEGCYPHKTAGLLLTAREMVVLDFKNIIRAWLDESKEGLIHPVQQHSGEGSQAEPDLFSLLHSNTWN